MIPDWQLPPGVDRGLWDYLHSSDMVASYDAQMAISPLATADVRFCEHHFQSPGRIIDLGCGTGRLARHFQKPGFDYLGVDLSEEMLNVARANNPNAAFQIGNLVDLEGIADASFHYAACLFSTLGMIRGQDQRRRALLTFHRILKPDGLLILHVHNRWFHGLGWRRFQSGDLTMPQAYGGAPLTLHHFSRSEITRELQMSRFRLETIMPIGSGSDGPIRAARWFPGLRAYGYLIAARRAE